MLLSEKLTNAGDFCFRHRTLQYIPYALVILVELEDLNRAVESIPLEIACFCVTLIGLLIRIFTIAYVPENTSGRNRREQIAETLNTKGMYSIVRNPLYVGNFFIFLGITLMTQSWEIVIANALLMLIFYTLIVFKEEEFLAGKFGDEYRNWTQKVNCFVPSFKNFEKTDKKFSIKKVIKNEHDTWLTAMICFLGIEIVRGFFETGHFYLIPLWTYSFGIIFIIWMISKILKKRELLN